MDEGRKFRIIMKAVIRLNPANKTVKDLIDTLCTHLVVKTESLEHVEKMASQFGWHASQKN